MNEGEEDREREEDGVYGWVQERISSRGAVAVCIGGATSEWLGS